MLHDRSTPPKGLCSPLRLGLGDQELQRLERDATVDLGDLVQDDHVVARQVLHQPLSQSDEEPLDRLVRADRDGLGLFDDGVCPVLPHRQLMSFVVDVVVAVFELALVQPLRRGRCRRVDRRSDKGLVVKTNPRHVTSQKIPAGVLHQSPLSLAHALQTLCLVTSVCHVICPPSGGASFHPGQV